MTFFRRILAGIVFLVATAMLLLSLAGGVGVWIVKEPATAKAAHVFERVEAALDKADQGLDHADASLGRAAERLESARQQQRRLVREPGKLDVARRFLARTVQQKIAPEMEDAHEKLHTVAEAAVVVNAVLEDVGNFPLLSVTGLNVDRLTEMNNQLAAVGPMAWELSRILGDARPGGAAEVGEAQRSRIEQTLKTMHTAIGEYHSQVTEVRERTEALKAKIFPWITPGAAIFSCVCFWIALSQISLLCHAWSWWKS
jgi:hypothetical protein